MLIETENIKKMNILVLGGTRFFGVHTVNELIKNGHDVTIATRGITTDSFGNNVNRVIYDRNDKESIINILKRKYYDVIIDKTAYCSNDIRNTLKVAEFGKYIYMSSTAVYDPLHIDTREEEFNPAKKKLVWCSRADYSYDEVKKQAECAIAQCYSDKNVVSVRYPVVMGKDDYTDRLKFYIDHTRNQQPMNIDNLNCRMSFINSYEAGRFIAYITKSDFFKGSVNGASNGTISIREILDYAESKIHKKAILDISGDKAPYNRLPDYSINTDKAAEIGYIFSDIKEWIFDVLDFYINKI